MTGASKRHSTPAETIHEACRYLCGFDVAGWEAHMRNDEVARVISDSLSSLKEQLEAAEKLAEDRARYAHEQAARMGALQEQLEAAETTLAHALDFIEHQDMSYRWAEWCEGRNPSNPAKRGSE